LRAMSEPHQGWEAKSLTNDLAWLVGKETAAPLTLHTAQDRNMKGPDKLHQ
jgi:hypothetical protein